MSDVSGQLCDHVLQGRDIQEGMDNSSLDQVSGFWMNQMVGQNLNHAAQKYLMMMVMYK